MRILACSSSRTGQTAYLETVLPQIQNFLGAEPLKILFLPFASVEKDHAPYLAKVQEALACLPYTLQLATLQNAATLMEEADVIMVGGGNTFKLLHDIYAAGLFALLQQKVQSGTPYIGWSAGANITGRSISTTNDMPIIEPYSFVALGFFPFQINPHYYNQVTAGFNGETRDQRLAEFIELNPNVPVVALPEGTALLLEADQLQLIGKNAAVLFGSKEPTAVPQKIDIAPGTNLSYLLA